MLFNIGDDNLQELIDVELFLLPLEIGLSLVALKWGLGRNKHFFVLVFGDRCQHFVHFKQKSLIYGRALRIFQKFSSVLHPSLEVEELLERVVEENDFPRGLVRQSLSDFLHVFGVAQHCLHEGLDVLNAPHISFFELELVGPRVVDLLEVRGYRNHGWLVRVDVRFCLGKVSGAFLCPDYVFGDVRRNSAKEGLRADGCLVQMDRPVELFWLGPLLVETNTVGLHGLVPLLVRRDFVFELLGVVPLQIVHVKCVSLLLLSDSDPLFLEHEGVGPSQLLPLLSDALAHQFLDPLLLLSEGQAAQNQKVEVDWLEVVLAVQIQEVVARRVHICDRPKIHRHF